MRLILVNPHYCDYGKRVSKILSGEKQWLKYYYFVKHFLNDENRDIAIYIDGTRTTIGMMGFQFPFFSRFFVFLELLLWMVFNNINPFKQKILFSMKQFDARQDIIVDFSRMFRLRQCKKTRQLREFQGISLTFLSHYFLDIEKVSKSVSAIPHCLAVTESNVARNGFFRKFFSGIHTIYQLPFVYGERFSSREPFFKRKNKCIALGSMCLVNDKDFIRYFKTDILHPMRKIISECAKQYSSEIDSLITPLEDVQIVKQKNRKIFSIVLDYIPDPVLKFLLLRKQRKEYYKFDIVEKYNEYRMFVCPEERIGVFSVNAFEGMACGTAYIGVDDPMYTDLGLKPGVHYITYKENDLNDLAAKIRYYQQHPKLLEKIAREGQKFVRTRFNAKIVADTLWSDLEKMSEEFMYSEEIVMHCSFNQEK